jgi:hypothetical protein
MGLNAVATEGRERRVMNAGATTRLPQQGLTALSFAAQLAGLQREEPRAEATQADL